MQMENDERIEALQAAIRADDAAAVEALLARHPELLNRHCRNGWTPLIVASYHDCASAGAVLLAAGADPNLPNHKGTTPLMYAKGHFVVHGGDAMTRLLLAHGADRDARDMHGLNLMDYVPDDRKQEVSQLIFGA